MSKDIYDTETERPIIKGNGFDGTEVGEDREDAQALVDFVNKRLVRIRELEALLGSIRGYMIPGNVMPVPEQAKYIVQWIDAALGSTPSGEVDAKGYR